MKIKTKREDDGRWFAEIPGLPWEEPVFAFGDSESAARRKAHARALHVAGATGVKIDIEADRRDYHHKFRCSRCGETIFVFGVFRRVPPLICGICKAIERWEAYMKPGPEPVIVRSVQSILAEGHHRRWSELPPGIKWHPDLRACCAIGEEYDDGGVALDCIYLDGMARAMREP
jgi:hypothetical protein